MTHLTRSQLAAAIAAGGAVLYQTRIIRRAEDLPSDDELTAAEAQALVVNASGGPGIDTTAVHVGETTTGSATLTGDIAAATAHVGGQAVPGPGVDTTAVHVGETTTGDATLTGQLRVWLGVATGYLLSSWGMQSEAKTPPTGLTAVLDAGIALESDALTPGAHTYQLAALDGNDQTTAASAPVTLTIPDGNTDGVRLTWNPSEDDYLIAPPVVAVYRDGLRIGVVPFRFLITGTPTFADAGWAGDAGSPAPTVNSTGGLVAQGGITAHGNPVAELGAIATETITPDKTITVYIDDVAYKIPAVLE